MTIFGLSFHWYGLILGIAILVALEAMYRKAEEENISREELGWVSFVGVVAGILGARVYHVITDWYLYQHHFLQAFAIWQGGLGIPGAIAGGALGVWLVLRGKKELRFATLLDIAAFGLPFGQAVGRLGNWVNQELYGLPTQLPWAVAIDVTHRLPGYEQFTTFHPLFAYEAVVMVCFGVGFWSWAKLKGKRDLFWQVGTGRYFVLYMCFYAALRFCLEFLRIDKSLFFGFALSVNQVVMACVFVIGMLWLLAQRSQKITSRKLSPMIMLVVLSLTLMSCKAAPRSEITTLLQQTKDGQQFQTTLGKRSLTLELAKTAASTTQGLSGRTSIGSDGLLFIMPSLGYHRFWMKEMLFPIDIVWFANNTVIDISPNLPPPPEGQRLEELPTYSPNQPADMVLELPAGQAEQWQIQVGDRLGS